jgi:hypothetical protein
LLLYPRNRAITGWGAERAARHWRRLVRLSSESKMADIIADLKQACAEK